MTDLAATRWEERAVEELVDRQRALVSDATNQPTEVMIAAEELGPHAAPLICLKRSMKT